MLCDNGAPVQACTIARSPRVERARASCSVRLKKLFCVYGVLPCGFCGSRSQQIGDEDGISRDLTEHFSIDLFLKKKL